MLVEVLHGDIVTGREGQNDHGHGYTCTWHTCTCMNIWVYGIGFIWDLNSYAQVQHADVLNIPTINPTIYQEDFLNTISPMNELTYMSAF